MSLARDTVSTKNTEQRTTGDSPLFFCTNTEQIVDKYEPMTPFPEKRTCMWVEVGTILSSVGKRG